MTREYIACGFALCLVFFSLPSSAHCQEPQVNPVRARAVGIRTLAGKHITIHTDLPVSKEVDRLPAQFDQAVPQWAAYFGVSPGKTDSWKVTAFLIADRSKFDALGLMPKKGDDTFRHGISMGNRLWLYDQPTDYYRRHLLLHEGTHCFMANFFGGCGPGWYMEGMAELLATHQIDADTGGITLRHMPANRQEVPMLGRIKLIRTAYSEDRALPIQSVFAIDNRHQLENEAYAWCWALARFLDDHPRYQQRFRTRFRTRSRNLLTHVTRADFNERLRKVYAGDWDELLIEWQCFVATLNHNHDIPSTAIEFVAGTSLGRSGKTVTVFADRGWQSTGIKLSAGKKYQLAAKGRYQIAEDSDGIWWCEPGGVTIEYHAGRPLGVLLAAIDPVGTDTPSRAKQFLTPQSVGRSATIVPKHDGTLYLRVNDSPGKLAGNSGTLDITVLPKASQER